jgi:ubiquinone/menaquinone biosynthesis C-methylase UbiE
VSKAKTQKELAFIYDLAIATDWGERFAELLDAHIKLPEKGRVLYLAAGTGGHALALQQKAAPEVVIHCVEEDAERLELARAKASTLKARMLFSDDEPDNLDFPDGHFALVLGDLALLPASRWPDIVQEAARVTAEGGAVALTITTAGSFGEFFSLYWEALFNAELSGVVAENLIATQTTLEDATAWAQQAGLKKVETRISNEEFTHENGQAFIESPLLADFLLPVWLAEVAPAARAALMQDCARLIDDFRDGANFNLSVKATILTGGKP